MLQEGVFFDVFLASSFSSFSLISELNLDQKVTLGNCNDNKVFEIISSRENLKGH